MLVWGHRFYKCFWLNDPIGVTHESMAQAHKLQIGFWQCCGSILGLGLGSLQPTTNLYAFLMVKQAENLREWAGLVSLREVMRGVVPMLMKGFRCWRGRNAGGSNAKRGMIIKGERIGGDILERGNFAGEKNKRSVASSELRAWGKASALWIFLKRRVTASQFWKSSSAYTDHIWWRFWGKHAEFSLLTVYLPRLHMLFLLPHHLFFPLIWRLYCLDVDNKGHTWLLLFASLIT